MKYLGTLFMAALAFAVVSCASSTKKAETNVEETVEKIENKTEAVVADAKATFNIEGMKCSKGCVKSVNEGIAAMPGIASAEVNYEEKTVEVEFNSEKTDAEKILAEIPNIDKGQFKGTIAKATTKIESGVEEAIEDAADAIEDAADEAGDKIEEAGEKIEKKVEKVVKG